MKLWRRKRYPANARSPYTGETLTWFQCGVHDRPALGSPYETPHHCIGIWDDWRRCDLWKPLDRDSAETLTAGAA